MTRNGKLPMAMAAVLALIAGGLYADPQTNTSSPQSDVTRGKIESDADYFMSVRNYANMDFDKWWGVVTYKTHFGEKVISSDGFAQIGFATRFGSLYTALSYRGNGFREFGRWSGGGGSVYSHTEKTTDGKTWKVFTKTPEIDERSGGGPNLRNEASVLLGLADMGFMLYYASSYMSNSVADYMYEGGYYKSLQEEFGHINPGITWGMTKELIPGRGIKPQVNIDLDFYRKYRMKEGFTNGDPAGGSAGMDVAFSENSFIPGLNVGMGALTLMTVNNFSLDFDLNYGIKWYLYENGYSYQDAAGKYQIKALPGGIVLSDGIKDASRIDHSLTPSISAGWSGDRLRLACRLGVPMTAYTLNETAKEIKTDSTDGSLVKQGIDDTKTVYTLNPALDLAMQWEIVPSMLFLNVGGKLAVFEATYSTTDRKIYANDVVDETNTQRGKFIRNEFIPAQTTLYLGVTFNLTPNMELQAALGVDSNNNINVFNNSFTTVARGSLGAGGFINFGNILVSLKY